jgi:hypothetical protein
MSVRWFVAACLAAAMCLGGAGPLRAQGPAVAEKAPDDFQTVPRDEVSIEGRFPELARQRLSLPEEKPARDAYYREWFGPVLTEAAGVPAGSLRDAAHRHRRTRARLSDADEFRVADDLRENMELYHFRSVQLHGTLRDLSPVAPPDEAGGEAGGGPWAYEGTLEVPGPRPLAVRLLVRDVPAGLVSGEVADPPVLVSGFLFRLYADAEYEDTESDAQTPLVVAPRLEWLRAAIDPRVFADVTDRTDITEAERNAYHHTLVQARLVDLADQKALAREVWRDMQPAIQADRQRTNDPKKWQRSTKPFIDLFKNPDLYRGKPVTLVGTMRKLTTFAAEEENEYDLTRLYEAWIFPEDGQGNPVAVVFTQKPEALPLGDEVNEHVRVTGYFFKMYAYPAHDTTRVAPMLLARTVERVNVGVPAEFPFALAIGGIAAVVLGVAAMLIYFRVKDRQYQSKVHAKHPDEPPAEITFPKDEPTFE